MEDLYQELGVEKTATPEQIKRAYRKRAQKAHPDRDTGNKEAFQKLQRAYDVLGDPQKRIHYDQTGRTDAPMEDKDALVRQQVIELLMNIILSHPQVEFVDVVAVAKQATFNQISDISSKIAALQGVLAKTEKAIKRITRKDGQNYMTLALESHRNNLNQNIAAAESKIEFTQCVQTELAHFKWKSDSMPAGLSGSVGFGNVFLGVIFP